MRKVADVRRGRPELEEPGIAEAERLAGAGLAARGGVSPDVIQQQKAQITAFANQWQLGNVDWKRFGKEVKERGWGGLALDVIDPTGRLSNIDRSYLMTAEGIARKEGGEAEKIWEKIKASPGDTFPEKMMNYWRGKGSIPLTDPEGNEHQIPIGGKDEQQQR
jgi:hypothetical protein